MFCGGIRGRSLYLKILSVFFSWEIHTHVLSAQKPLIYGWVLITTTVTHCIITSIKWHAFNSFIMRTYSFLFEPHGLHCTCMSAGLNSVHNVSLTPAARWPPLWGQGQHLPCPLHMSSAHHDACIQSVLCRCWLIERLTAIPFTTAERGVPCRTGFRFVFFFF